MVHLSLEKKEPAKCRSVEALSLPPSSLSLSLSPSLRITLPALLLSLHPSQFSLWILQIKLFSPPSLLLCLSFLSHPPTLVLLPLMHRASGLPLGTVSASDRGKIFSEIATAVPNLWSEVNTALAELSFQGSQRGEFLQKVHGMVSDGEQQTRTQADLLVCCLQTWYDTVPDANGETLLKALVSAVGGRLPVRQMFPYLLEVSNHIELHQIATKLS